MRKLIKRILTDKVALVSSIGFTFLVLYLSLTSPANLPEIEIKQVDKLYHFTVYFFLSMAWFSYFYMFKNIQQDLSFIFIAGAIIFFGIVVEVLQKNFTDNRIFDWWDILSNSAGIMIVYFFFKYNKTKLGKLRRQLKV